MAVMRRVSLETTQQILVKILSRYRRRRLSSCPGALIWEVPIPVRWHPWDAVPLASAMCLARLRGRSIGLRPISFITKICESPFLLAQQLGSSSNEAECLRATRTYREVGPISAAGGFPRQGRPPSVRKAANTSQ